MDRGAVQHHHAGKPLQDRCQRAVRPDDLLHAAAEQPLQERDQLGRVPLVDGLRGHRGPALPGHLGQLLVRGGGMLQEAQDKRPRQRQAGEDPPALDHRGGIRGLLSGIPKQPLQGRTHRR